MLNFPVEQKVCEIGGVKLGGRPGEYPTVIVPSIFQKGDKVFEGKKRKEGFDEKRAEDLLKTTDKLAAETGIPCMADIVANTGEEFKRYIDFVTSVSDMPFCIDAWVMKPKLEGAAYCAEKGLLDRMFYNSLTVWEKDIETEIKEISDTGVKHVLLVAFDQEDQMPTGRITGTQKLLDAIDKVGAHFESIIVDTSVMNGPATALCSLSNKLIKEKWGFPCASAPSNGSYMWKAAREMWGFKGWAGADAALEALAAVMYHDMIFSGPMAGSPRIFPAVAMADAFLATLVFGEEKRLPESKEHPIYKLFPEFIQQLENI
ncbi:MAG: tetrahydromethanopterin S-methyltransferase subunit H [Deltaproteobacteria bacterium]|nr:tetrahydromethanopterin S-methyltransferase subunit H [Deltaproteobacteria bacterium]MBW1929535.1 tetrahydromethanopterin S-methyltransferase subunit H [Deltaproteobacteria bacterium]MBW2024049.1 tetrahydromethanopterin S-methyltransferase subunit H [Deltaproteobacteria bacterium]MBW2124400.1 tetrahydromethanopterin S-methyltransferase subunit H [Deltaproteobacteria bacterium]RLB24573.1 MAG: tetrahydromethanopterin S-methyltransferase [Deltaproteobacteria bacterium]